MSENSTRHSVCILIATYNSSKFLSEQLDSIVKQNYCINNIIISDDGSRDGTPAIVREYSDAHRDLDVSFNTNTSGEKGPRANFAHLCLLAMRHEADYYFFCDHDDVWLEDKVSKSVEMLKHLEGENSCQTPILIHTGLEVMDETMQRSFGSLSKYQGLPSAKLQPLSMLLHQNVVTGCSVGFNQALLKFATPIPQSAIMHDHWFAICARSAGVIEYLPELLVRYRQHSDNSIGALNAAALSNYFRPEIYQVLLRFPKHFIQCTYQARALNERAENHGFQLASRDKKAITTFASLGELGFFYRIISGLEFFPNPSPILTRCYQIMLLMFLPVMQLIYRVRK